MHFKSLFLLLYVAVLPFNCFSVRRQYPPVSLLQLQRLIDLGWINTQEPVDLTTIAACPIRKPDVKLRHYGYNLTDEVRALSDIIHV